jgi:N-acetylneuraminic acid mutarotase
LPKQNLCNGDPTQVYDPATGTWENKTAIPLTIFGYKANVVDDKIYVISGGKPTVIGAVVTSATSYVYDPATDSWLELAPIPTPVQAYASAVLDSKIYIIGGGTSELTSNASDLVQIYDIKTNQWINGTSIPTGVYGAGACATSGHFAPKRIYVVGGNLKYSGGGTSADLNPKGTNLNQVYDLETGTWSSAASLPDSRWFLSLVNINDALYAVGGVNASYLLTSINIQATAKYIPAGYDASLLPAPSPSPTPAPSEFTANLPIILGTTVIIVIAATAGLAVYHKKHKKNT